MDIIEHTNTNKTATTAAWHYTVDDKEIYQGVPDKTYAGHAGTSRSSTPSSSNVKFTKVTYYCIGVKDSYVKLYDLKFTNTKIGGTAEATPVSKTLMSSNITQLSGTGNYNYNNGTLMMNATGTGGYSVKMNVTDTINPSELKKLLMDVNSTALFNVSVRLSNGNGDATMNLKDEIFN